MPSQQQRLDINNAAWEREQAHADAARFVTSEANEIFGLPPMPLNVVSMSREQWAARLPLITAFAEGRLVMVRRENDWHEFTTQAHFDLPLEEYRLA